MARLHRARVLQGYLQSDRPSIPEVTFQSLVFTLEARPLLGQSLRGASILNPSETS